MARVAVVTGGTRGIGRAISVALKDAGYKVAANYGRDDKTAQEFSAETGIPVFKFDVADFDACAEGVKAIEAQLGGPVEVLVNNAGITRDTTMHRMSFEQWNAVIQTNLSSCFNMSRAVIDGMRDRRFGRIVNIGSINGQAGQYGQVNYAAAKSGIHGFTKALAQEGARRAASPSTPWRRAMSIPRWCAPCRRTSWKRSSPASRSAASARPRTSRARSCSWSPTTPISSPARPCRSTAASICIEAGREEGDCVVAALVAMTAPLTVIASEAISMAQAYLVRSTRSSRSATPPGRSAS